MNSLVEDSKLSCWSNKKLSMAEISSILNSEELLKQKFKENLHNIWKISNEISTNDENNSQMKKTNEFSLKNEFFAKNEAFIRNNRKESIPNLLNEDEELLEVKYQKNHDFDSVFVEKFVEKMDSSASKIKSNLEISSKFVVFMVFLSFFYV